MITNTAFLSIYFFGKDKLILFLTSSLRLLRGFWDRKIYNSESVRFPNNYFDKKKKKKYLTVKRNVIVGPVQGISD